MKRAILLIAAGIFCYCESSSVLAAQCDDETSAAAIVEGIDNDVMHIRDERKAREATIERQIDSLASSLVQRKTWTTADRARFFTELLKSDDFIAFEKKKRASFALFGLAAQTMVIHRKNGNVKEACISAEQMKEQLVNVGEVNDNQYAFMLAKVQAVVATP